MINNKKSNYILMGALCSLSLLTLLLLSVQTAQARSIGIIHKVVGDASLLLPGKHKATMAKKGSQVLNDSSIYCPGDCYITVKFKDELAFLKLGKESKVMLHTEPSQNALYISLVTGYFKLLFKGGSALRSTQIQTPNAKIETENSSLLVSYSPLLERTSVINFKGMSIFYKKNQSQKEIILKKDHYSFVERGMDRAKDPEFFPKHKASETQKLFNIKDASSLNP